MMQLELGVKNQMNTDTNITKQNVAETTAHAKIISSHIDKDGKAISSAINSEAALEKQKIANQKPNTSKKS